MIATMMRHLHSHRLAAVGEPGGHEIHLVLLARIDPAGERDDIFIVGAAINQRGHFNSLLVVNDHALHEIDIGRRIGRTGKLARLFDCQNSVPFTGRTRLHDWNTLRKCSGGTAYHQRGNSSLHTCR